MSLNENLRNELGQETEEMEQSPNNSSSLLTTVEQISSSVQNSDMCADTNPLDSNNSNISTPENMKQEVHSQLPSSSNNDGIVAGDNGYASQLLATEQLQCSIIQTSQILLSPPPEKKQSSASPVEEIQTHGQVSVGVIHPLEPEQQAVCDDTSEMSPPDEEVEETSSVQMRQENRHNNSSIHIENSGCESLESETPVVTVSNNSNTHIPGDCNAGDISQSSPRALERLQQVNPEPLIGPVDSSTAVLESVVMQEYSQRVHQQEHGFMSGETSDRYNLTENCVPSFIAEARHDFQHHTVDNFLRGCKWSPDGRCVVTNSNDNKLRLYTPCLDHTWVEASDLTQAVVMKEGSQIYDFSWHPKMSSNYAESCRIVCTCSGIPIHLWNSHSGQRVASYRAYDQYDEVTAAYSVSFCPDGSKLYAGYNKKIRIFDTEYPGRSCQAIKTFDSRKKDGQTGIISCFAHSPDGGLYVAGSYSRNIGIYSTGHDKLICQLQGQRGGVTHLLLSPDASKLYSGGRKDAEILCWDMRNTGKILYSVLRDVKTNQRIYFDLSKSGRYLTSGNHDGSVTFWDTLSPGEEVNGEVFLRPCSQYQAHRDCVNGVSFNHEMNILATASGQRHFGNLEDYDSDDSTQDEPLAEKEIKDFSLKFWRLPVGPETVDIQQAG